MRLLTLVCDCGEERTFRFSTVTDLLRQMDQTGWADVPDAKEPRGRERGYCPKCLEAQRANTPEGD